MGRLSTSVMRASNTRARRQSFDAFALEVDHFKRVCEIANTPRSLACYLISKYNAWDEYLSLPSVDFDKACFASDDYLVTQMMRKNPRIPSRHDTKANALQKWHLAEEMCASSNARFSALHDGASVDGSEMFMPSLKRARAIIRSILGPLNRSRLDRIERQFRFGPGASSTCSGRDVLPSRKMVSVFETTPRLSSFIDGIVGPFWGQLLKSSETKGNKLTFVPKDSTTDRPISIEPHGNMYVQLGIGSEIRYCLKRTGLDLDTQADKNRQFAKDAFLRSFATIDLASASDTISYWLVRFLLPEDWFYLLDISRSPMVYHDSFGWRPVHKFSSMGNGFTFELETLIFYALSLACGDDVSQVFGDDIIVRQTSAATLVPLLEFCGFKVNRTKTYLNGYFFESCGEDFYLGTNIRPYFLKKASYYDRTEMVIRLANRVRTYSHRRNSGFGCDVRFMAEWTRLVNLDQSALRTAIPKGSGDAGLIRNFDETCPPIDRALYNRGIRRYRATTYRGAVTYARRTSPTGAYLRALAYGNLGDSSFMLESPRGDIGNNWKHRAQLVESWPDLGPWI